MQSWIREVKYSQTMGWLLLENSTPKRGNPLAKMKKLFTAHVLPTPIPTVSSTRVDDCDILPTIKEGGGIEVRVFRGSNGFRFVCVIDRGRSIFLSVEEVVRAVCALRMPSRSTAAQLNGNKHSLWMNTLFGNLVSASGTTPTGDERHHTRNTRYLHGFDDERRRPLYLRSASIIAFYHYNIEWTHQLLFGPLERASPANEGLLYAFTLRLHTIAWASTP
ncbi:hypothetical protein B0H11DRAFT_1918096 [Mycena galericulata]|nr:hypothetical protein B0H11DRAFT_1918096 [Mycena galericulata]